MFRTELCIVSRLCSSAGFSPIQAATRSASHPLRTRSASLRDRARARQSAQDEFGTSLSTILRSHGPGCQQFASIQFRSSFVCGVWVPCHGVITRKTHAKTFPSVHSGAHPVLSMHACAIPRHARGELGCFFSERWQRLPCVSCKSKKLR